MTWPIPVPADIADRMAGGYEAEFARLYARLNPSAPPARVDARSDYSTLAIQARVQSMELFNNWMFQQRLARELMPDTAQDWLSRHGQEWGVPRVQASAASAPAQFSGRDGVVIPSGLSLSAPGGATYVTTGSATVAGGTATVTVQATTAGAAGTLQTGLVLTVVSPLAGLSPQTAVVQAGGIAGQDIEDVESWRARIIRRIRQRGGGGTEADFEEWTQEVYPGALVKATTPGPGQVNLAFALPSGTTWRAPTVGEVAAVTAYLNDTLRRPLGTPAVLVVAATLVTVPVTLHLIPDTTATRAGATAALASYFGSLNISDDVIVELLDVAITEGSGETTHTRSAPAADVAIDLVSLAVLGAVTFT